MFKKFWKKVKKSVGKHTGSTKQELPGRGLAQPEVVSVVKTPRPPVPTAVNNCDMAAVATEVTKSVRVAGACPSYAAKSVVGQRMTMEDSWQAVPDLLVVPKWWTCNARDHLPPPLVQPGQVPGDPQLTQQQEQQKEGTGADAAPSGTTPTDTTSSGRREDAAAVSSATAQPANRPALDPQQQAAMHGTDPVNVHFFAVYDGHGGPDVAKHCAKSLHEHLRAVVTASVEPDGRPAPGPLSPAPPPVAPPAPSTSETGVSKGNGLESGTGAQATKPATAGDPPPVEVWPARVDGIEAALKAAFLHTDAQLAQNRSAHEVGTTAVVSLVTARTLWIGNCGDSRALLCRDNEAVALSLDHKATRIDEVSRVEQAGGYVWWDRVMGELAVSRAIGDHCLRPFVIAEPEITSVLRRPKDQLLIMASDGLWDVFTNEEARTLALEKFNGELARTNSSKMAVKKAASSLAKAALAKGSRDNVTVVVVDVRVHGLAHGAAGGASRGTCVPQAAASAAAAEGSPAAAEGSPAAAEGSPAAAEGSPAAAVGVPTVAASGQPQQQLAPASPATPGASDVDD